MTLKSYAPAVLDDMLRDLADDIIAALSEGDGQHTEALDRNLIAAKVRWFLHHTNRLPIVSPELQKPVTGHKHWSWEDVSELSPQQVADAMNELERLREINARRVVNHLRAIVESPDDTP